MCISYSSYLQQSSPLTFCVGVGFLCVALIVMGKTLKGRAPWEGTWCHAS